MTRPAPETFRSPDRRSPGFSVSTGGGATGSRAGDAIAIVALLLTALGATALAASTPKSKSKTAKTPAATATAPASAPPSADDGSSTSSEREQELQCLVDLRQKEAEDRAKQIEAQQKALEEQAEQIEAMKRRQEILDGRLLALEAASGGEGTSTKELAERLAKIESSVQQKPELPPDVVSAGNFPGSFRIPGSAAAMKIGGLVRASLVQTFDALGSDDRFLTYSIPVEGSEEAGKGERLSLWAGASRFNVDVRTPTEVGQIRAFLEGDFAGQGGAFRLRHAYGQLGPFLVGQTWSTFSDPDADHEDIDFEGVNAENVQRQAQVRWSGALREGLRFALAIEYPTASISGGQAVNQVPDVVGRLTWKLPREGHLQTAAVVRQVRGELNGRPNVVESAFAWGLSASGVVTLPKMPERDRLIFQANFGQGIARYINDLNSAGGQDAIFTPDGELRTLQAFGYYLDYEHRWEKPSLFGHPLNDVRTSLIWGHVSVNNLKEQPGDAYRQTGRLSLGVVWSPISRVDVGAELLWGRRENKDGQSGTARQLQLRMRFLF